LIVHQSIEHIAGARRLGIVVRHLKLFGFAFHLGQLFLEAGLLDCPVCPSHQPLQALDKIPLTWSWVKMPEATRQLFPKV
jgi:hypothetical protein